MTNNLLSLLKTEFLNRFRLGTIRNERNKKVKYRNIAMGVLYIFLAIVLAGYCFAISYGYSYLGMSYVVPGYALMITSIVILFFTFLKTNGILFSTRDYDMLTAFPIKTIRGNENAYCRVLLAWTGSCSCTNNINKNKTLLTIKRVESRFFTIDYLLKMSFTSGCTRLRIFLMSSDTVRCLMPSSSAISCWVAPS